MSWSFSIGRLFGSDLRVHATFFLLLAWIGLAAWAEGGPVAALVNLAFILALFACVVAHEFGHALMARRFGIRTPDITLLPIGGMARLERMPEKPGQEIAVALAGPAVNVVIWALITLILGVETDAQALARLEDPAGGFLARLAAVNLFLVLFNMIPAFPMDGGRVLRALLSMRMGRVKATRAAGLAGQAIAFGFGLMGLLTGNLLLMLIAVFVFMAAAAESSDVALRETTHSVPAREAMITNFETLGPTDSLETAARTLIRTTQHEFPVVDQAGALLGFLTRQALMAGIEDGARTRPVAEAMVRDIPALRLDAPLDGVLDALAQGAPAVAITDARGGFLGYVTRENLGEWMVVGRRR